MERVVVGGSSGRGLRGEEEEEFANGGGGERLSGCKRGLERDEDEEMEGVVGGDDDWERFGGRTFAPFVDLPME